MEKKEKSFGPNVEAEFKDNRIFSWEPKKWTCVIGWLGIVFLLLILVTGAVAAFAFEYSIIELEEQQAMTADGVALEFWKVLWMFVWLGVLMHTLLLKGNAMDESIFLLPWLAMMWALLLASTWALASSQTVEPPFQTVMKLVVYVVTMGFPLYVVHRRYNELRAWDRKMIDLEEDEEV